MTGLQAGSATTDVTPDSRVPMSGYAARETFSTGVHDPLAAAALVVSDGSRTVGVVSADALNVSRSVVAAVRRRLSDRGVRFDELVVAATHTHAGPYVPTPAIEMDSLLTVDADPSAGVEALVDGVADALSRAHERLEPASIRVGRAAERDVQHNRRASGGVGGNVRLPTGDVDPAVLALLVETDAGDRTVLYNFACHPVCTTSEETLISADWPGYARERVREVSPDADVLYLNGAAGDVNPTGATEPRSGETVYEYMADVGSAVGDAVLDAVENAEGGRSVAEPPIVAKRIELSLPLKATPPQERLEARLDELETATEACESNGDEVGRETLREYEQYVRNLQDISAWGARTLAAPLPYVEIGGVGIVGLPGEVLVEHGRAFKERADADVLLPAGYANEYVGYVPPLAELENGGYEVRMSKVSPEGIRTFREEVLELVGGELR